MLHPRGSDQNNLRRGHDEAEAEREGGEAGVNWPRLGNYVLAAIFLILTTLLIAGLLNFTGDCSPEVTDCGGTGRRLSFGVVGGGALALAYMTYRFIRGQR